MDRIRLGYLNPFAPFCRADGPSPQGSLVTALRARVPAGVDLDWHPGALADLPHWLAEGRIDAILGKAITPGRAGAFAFSAPLVRTAAALFGLPGQEAPHPGALGAARIATPAEGPLAALLAGLAPGAEVIGVADYAAALAAVEAGMADWAALNADVTPALFPGRTGPAGPRWAPLGLAVAVTPGDPDGVLARLGLQPDFPVG